jgi:hypothetical protein
MAAVAAVEVGAILQVQVVLVVAVRVQTTPQLERLGQQIAAVVAVQAAEQALGSVRVVTVDQVL